MTAWNKNERPRQSTANQQLRWQWLKLRTLLRQMAKGRWTMPSQKGG